MIATQQRRAGRLKPARAPAFTALALAALIAPQAVEAQTGRQAATVIMPEDKTGLEFQNAVGFADAIVTGDTIYLSGVVAGPAPGETGLASGFDRAFAQIGKVLERSGVSWDDVVDMTTFHTDLAGQVDAFVEVNNRYVEAPFSTWTAIGISALYEPTAVTEIKVVAKRRVAP